MRRAEGLLRVFVAVKVDNPLVLSRVSQLQQDLEKAGIRAKFVEPENLHITLRFVGEIPQAGVELLRRRLFEVRYEPFTMVVKGVGGFPTISSPRVLWLGVEEGAPRLEELARMVNGVVNSLKLGKEESEERFAPHLTIARLKGPLTPTARKILGGLSDAVLGEQHVDCFYLFKSTLTPRGPVYSVIEKYALTGK